MEKTDGKGRELDAIQKLLQVLDLQGAVVTIDALGCQKEVAQLIVEAKADYLLQVKDNQPTLLAKLTTLFAEAALEKYQGFTHATCTTVDGDHGRLETREAHILWDVRHLGALAGEWAGLHSLALIRRTREMVGPDGQPAADALTKDFNVGPPRRITITSAASIAAARPPRSWRAAAATGAWRTISTGSWT